MYRQTKLNIPLSLPPCYLTAISNLNKSSMCCSTLQASWLWLWKSMCPAGEYKHCIVFRELVTNTAIRYRLSDIANSSRYTLLDTIRISRDENTCD